MEKNFWYVQIFGCGPVGVCGAMAGEHQPFPEGGLSHRHSSDGGRLLGAHQEPVSLPASVDICNGIFILSLQSSSSTATDSLQRQELFILSLSSLLYLPLGVRDEEKVVRNASLFAIGQFSEHLQVNPYPHSQLRINSSSLFLFLSFSLSLPLFLSSSLSLPLSLSLPPSSLR